MDALQKLGIDLWGVLLYLVNFGVIFLVLRRFVVRPLLRFLDARQMEIATNLQAAETMRSTIAGEQQAEAEARAVREQELAERLRAAKTLARDEAKKLVSEAEAQRDAILSQTREAADAMVANTLDEAEAEVQKRIREVVSYVLEHEVPEKVVAASVEKGWNALVAPKV